ncbi:hypothetical protein Bhyg_07102 [Pseudolycoriella hygida]|uniref:Uncharacterized protein n=1 Tax=Pseudolycoriella hygida TaxID=35572 RepID=A0A9Q0N1Y0_9DIPT|nr:hypothetical protein Bhyg_07102 [Pseudolycoriella hygida]
MQMLMYAKVCKTFFLEKLSLKLTSLCKCVLETSDVIHLSVTPTYLHKGVVILVKRSDFIRVTQANIRVPQANIRVPQANIRVPQANIRVPQANIRNYSYIRAKKIAAVDISFVLSGSVCWKEKLNVICNVYEQVCEVSDVKSVYQRHVYLPLTMRV